MELQDGTLAVWKLVNIAILEIIVGEALLQSLETGERPFVV